MLTCRNDTLSAVSLDSMSEGSPDVEARNSQTTTNRENSAAVHLQAPRHLGCSSWRICLT